MRPHQPINLGAVRFWAAASGEVMRKLQVLIASVGFAAAMFSGGRVLGGAEHAHADAPAAAHAPAAATDAKTDAHAAPAGVAAADALKMLADGNARFVAGAPTRPHQDTARLCDTFANGQHPYAAVLSCADSRVPVELVFDAGIGDLFVVRVAGNVGDVDETGTLEYGVEHLGINAIVVVGHTKCGAVTAVVDGAHVTKNIEQLVDNIAPAADQARKAFPQLSGPRLVDKAIRANVNCAIADLLKNSELLRARVASGPAFGRPANRGEHA
jgi:carbonic anhydrase